MILIILFEEYFKERKDFCLKLFKFIFFIFFFKVIFIILFLFIIILVVLIVVVVRIFIRVFLFSCNRTSLIIYIYRGSRGSTEEKQKGKKLERSHYWIGSV